MEKQNYEKLFTVEDDSNRADRVILTYKKQNYKKAYIDRYIFKKIPDLVLERVFEDFNDDYAKIDEVCICRIAENDTRYALGFTTWGQETASYFYSRKSIMQTLGYRD